MNILMALSQLEVTGAEVYAVSLADELIKRKHNVYIVSDTLTKKTNAPYYPIAFNQRRLKDRYAHVKELLKIIKKHNIHIVHAHSRASSWSCNIACKIAKIPLVTTTHGRQPVHLSRKVIKAFGQKTICVCQNIQDHLIADLAVKKDHTYLLANPIDTKIYTPYQNDSATSKTISIIGRLSGPKGLVVEQILQRLVGLKDYKINIIGGKNIPQFLQKYTAFEHINFVGYVNNVDEYIKQSDIIIGAGRVALEALLCQKPTIGVGEAIYEGLITRDNLSKAMASNFGDINKDKATDFNFDKIPEDVCKAYQLSLDEKKSIRQIIVDNYDIEHIITKVQSLYDYVYCNYKKYAMPILMYHRVVKSKQEQGVHGTYLDIKKFKAHLEYLKRHNYQTIGFKELSDYKYNQLLNSYKKPIILTFDDGYIDNYTIVFKLLKEYNFKCVIYILSDLKYNKWDCENKDNPELRLELMDDDMIKQMQEYGIEFGCHSKTHPYLAQLNDAMATDEIVGSKKLLEQKLGEKIISFAYPYGSYKQSTKDIVQQAGFEFAVATDSGPINLTGDFYAIRRIGIFPGNSMLTFKRKVSGKYLFLKHKIESFY